MVFFRMAEQDSNIGGQLEDQNSIPFPTEKVITDENLKIDCPARIQV
jgi:hypothetical protein